MEIDLIFRIILGILFLVTLVTRRYYERQAAATAAQGLQQDQDDKRIITLQSALLTISLIALIVYVINPAWMSWSTIELPDWLRWIGAVLGSLGAVLLVWTHRVLGKNFFGGMKIREQHQLIQEGPYHWMRHPMYTAFILLGLGFFLLSGNWLIGGAWLSATILVIATRLDAEEQMMVEQFGEQYEDYQRRTGRFLPRF